MPNLDSSGFLWLLGLFVAGLAMTAVGVWGWAGRTAQSRRWASTWGPLNKSNPGMKLGFLPGGGLFFVGLSVHGLRLATPVPLSSILAFLGSFLTVVGGMVAIAGIIYVIPGLIAPPWYRKQAAKKRRAEKRRRGKKQGSTSTVG